MPSISWNIITKNIQLDSEVQTKLRQKIAQLEGELKALPPEKIHLQITLSQHPKKPLYTSTLTLRTPANIFSSKESASDLIKAFDNALQVLVKELESPKGNRAREVLRKSADSRERQQAPENAGFSEEPQLEGAGPQNLQDVIREFFRHNYHRLLHHARRHIRHEELMGEIPVGALDPRDVVDEMARKAETSAQHKPAKINWLVWFFHLLHEELHRQFRLFKQKQVEEIPVEERTTLPELKMRALQPLEQMVEKVIEPQIIRTEDIVPNPETLPPDQVVEAKELLEELQHAIQTWPGPERDVFELYFIQGFEPGEIAGITGQPVKKVKETLATVHRRLREQMLEQEAIVQE